VLGQVFDRFGWPACVLGIGLALAVSLVLATQMRSSPPAPAAALIDRR
jgi:hypothetical protein